MANNSVYKVGIVISADASSVKPATAETRNELASLGGAATGAQSKMQALIATATGLHAGAANGNSRAWTGALAAEGLALDALRAKYNPMFAVIQQYKAAQAEIRTAHAMGALSADEMTAAMQRQRQAALASIDVIKGRNAVIAQGNAPATTGNGHNFAATNAMFQLQDIGMTAAMGMSPAMIALQQGSQLAGGFSGMGLKQVGSTMLGAFTQLLSPVSLATVAITGLTAAAIQYFTRSRDASDGMSEDLREQADLIGRVAKAWDGATPKITAYADQMEKAASVAERLKAGETLAREQYNPVENALSGLRQPFSAARAELAGYGPDAAPALKTMTDAVTSLQSKIKAGTATTDDLTNAQRALGDTLIQTGTPAVRRFVDEFAKVAPQIRAAVDAAKQFRDEGAGLTLPKLGQLSPLFSAGGKIRSEEDFIPKGSLPIPTSRPLIELEGLPGQIEAEKALAAAKRDRARSITETLAAQQLELSLIGRTISESEALRMQYQLTAALKAEAANSGVAVDQDELRLIEEKSRAYGKLAEQIAATNMIRDQQETLQQLQAELALVGQSEAVRRQALAALEAERQIRREGLSALSQEANLIRQNAGEEARRRLELEKTTDAWGRYKSAGENAIDTIFDGLGNLESPKDILKNLAGDFGNFAMDMMVKNPLKNALLGTNYGTLSDLGGLLSGAGGSGLGFGNIAVPGMSVNSSTVCIRFEEGETP